jgi:hypothetical protein
VATVEELATAHYLRQQRTVRHIANQLQSIWRTLDANALDQKWPVIGPAIVQVVKQGQVEAAAPADAYLAAVIAADGVASEPAGTIAASAFAGHAADGRSLLSLFYEPVIETKWRLEAGQSAADAMTGSLSTLLRAGTTEVADAGRTAAGVGIASNRAVTGYVRTLSPPSCSRCVVLAGLVFKTDQAFDRHPRCDCTNVPISAGGRRGATPLTDPKAYFRSLSEAEQARVFTIDGAKAIRDGADIGQIVNARRGMYTASAYGTKLRSTHVSTTKRSRFYRLERQRAIQRGLVPPTGKGFRLTTHRLMPEEIYARAENRDEVISMLRRYGYLI